MSNELLVERPLAKVRVLDLTRLLPGPFASRVLLDLGAGVDKLEDPHAGDYMRIMPPQIGGMNALFHALARGTRSVILDLKKSEGRDAFLRMLPHYDVLIESFRPGVMERLGLSYTALSKRAPKLVYCAISGYGQTGPLANRAGHDLNYLARSGVLGVTGPADGSPQVPGTHAADISGGLFSVTGILAALYARSTTGRGRFIDISMSESVMQLALVGLMSNGVKSSHEGRGEGLLTGGIAPYNTYATKDGGFVALAALEPKFWNTFCEGVGIEPSMEALAAGPHQSMWKEKLASIFLTRTRDEWASFASAHDCCLEAVLMPDELVADPQHEARALFHVASFGDEGSLAYPRTPTGAKGIVGTAPAHGEHTREVLRESGLSDADIDALFAQHAAR